MTADPDLVVADCVSLAVVRCGTDAGRQWVGAHVYVEPWQWVRQPPTPFGAFAVDQRYVDALAAGAEADGLTVGCV